MIDTLPAFIYLLLDERPLTRHENFYVPTAFLYREAVLFLARLLAKKPNADYIRYHNRYPMKLNLTVADKVLASVAIHPSQETDEYYLKALRRLLLLRHQQKLSGYQQTPSFSIEQQQTKQNKVVH